MGARVLADTKMPTRTCTPECLYPQAFGLLLCVLFPSDNTAQVPGDHSIPDTSGKRPINMFVVKPHHATEVIPIISKTSLAPHLTLASQDSSPLSV